MSDLLVRLTELETQIKEDEKQAIAHEIQARELRAHRNALKLELSELHKMVVDSRMVHASEAAAKAAEGAKQIAETSVSEINTLKDDMRHKTAEVTELAGALKGLIEKAQAREDEAK